MKNRAAGNVRPPPPHSLHGCVVNYLVQQQPEPQQLELPQFSRSAVAPAVGHSSSQHSHRHAAHSQVPVSQQPQQSQAGQLRLWPPSIAAPQGTRPSAAQRRKLFMGKPSLHEKIESITPRHNA